MPSKKQRAKAKRKQRAKAKRTKVLDDEAWLRDIHTLEDAIHSKRFGRKTLARLNVAIKKKHIGVISKVSQVSACTLGGLGVRFQLNASDKPLTYIETYDKTKFRFIQMKSVVSVCDGCQAFLPVTHLQKCSACKIVEYCSQDCQNKHWKRHKACCKVAGVLAKGKSVAEKRIQIVNPLKTFIRR